MVKRFLALQASVLLLLLCMVPAHAAGLGVKLSGAKSVLPGGSLEIAVTINGSGIFSVQGSVLFDSGLLQYTGFSGGRSGWAHDVEASGGKVNILSIDNNLSSPITGYATLLTLKFQLKSTTPAGSALYFSTSGMSASDGMADFSAATVKFQSTVTKPVSGNSSLASLTVGNANLSPAFRPDVLQYKATVPNSCTALELTSSAADSGARVKMNGNKLKIGENQVTLTVTAANGSVTIYTIRVTREASAQQTAAPTSGSKPEPTKQERPATEKESNSFLGTSVHQQTSTVAPSETTAPASAPAHTSVSGNARLKSIVPNQGILSPAFTPKQTEYVLYLPFEVTAISFALEAEDKNASCNDPAELELQPGDNPVSFRITAQDGSVCSYEILVRRMPQYPNGDDSTADSDTTTQPNASFSWLQIAACMLCFLLGGAVVWLLLRRKTGNHPNAK